MQLDNEILSPPAHPVHWSCAFVDLLYPMYICMYVFSTRIPLAHD